MSDYYISQIAHTDKTAIQNVTALLQAEGIRLDANLDYTCGMYDEEMNIIATGSCFGNTLRCLAVSSDHQGEGLMNQIISHLIEVQFERGNTQMFFRQILRRPRVLRNCKNRRTDRIHGKQADRIQKLSKETGKSAECLHNRSKDCSSRHECQPIYPRPSVSGRKSSP